jgi:hypothetical protein
MDFDKIQFVMIGKHIKIFTDLLKKVVVSLDLECPFGNEHNNHLIYNNWILNDENFKLFQDIEQSFFNYMVEQYSIDSEWKWKSSLRKNSRFGSLLRTTNSFDYEYEKESLYSVDIIIDSVWLHRKTKTFGLLLKC